MTTNRTAHARHAARSWHTPAELEPAIHCTQGTRPERMGPQGPEPNELRRYGHNRTCPRACSRSRFGLGDLGHAG